MEEIVKTTKICTKCGEEKNVSEFGKSKNSKDGLKERCKCCRKLEAEIYRKENHEKILLNQRKSYAADKKRYNAYNKKSYNLNKEKILKTNKDRYYKNIEQIKIKAKKKRDSNIELNRERGRKYYNENKNSISEKRKILTEDKLLKRRATAKNWALKNKNKITEYRIKYRKTHKNYISEYYQNNKAKINEQKNKNRTKKLLNDPLCKLIKNIRTRLYLYLKIKNITKNNKTFDIIGCSPIELKQYLEEKFTDGMTWDNQGEWHIDHIIPLSSGKTESEVLKLCHYTNLQPLWAKDNLQKGNKIIKND